jgi:predicted amidohydrolase YtcJ
MTDTTVFEARSILTMNPSQPRATHVAVRDGRILAVGTAQDVNAWGPSKLNQQFAQQVLLPGLVEGHSHLMAGTLWRYVYCGYFDATDPSGRVWPGLKTLDAVVAALAKAANDSAEGMDPNAKGLGQPIVGWGFDPIYFGQQRCNRADLDRVSVTRAVGVLHASGHILNVNTAALQAGGFWRTGIDHPAFPVGTDGLPTGELKGPEAMMPMLDHVGLSRSFLSGDETGIRDFARLCVRAGVTTATDLAATLGDAEVATLLRLSSEDRYPVRIVPLLRMIGMKPADAIARAVALKSQSTERLRLGHVKVVADGSIQGFSARLRWPGYFNGQPNGLWYTAPEAMREAFTLGLQAGVLIHTHTNGDEATELVLDCMQQALTVHPRADHRYTLQHCQLADEAQYRRIKALGLCVNLFANHHFYWGDQHFEVTVGPERARRMNACRTALDTGVPMAIHSDAPITPLGPLFTAWCAVHRLTASGRVLGEQQCITVPEALRAITLGAAYTLRLDGEIGSIECGKRADFCVLDDDPTALPSSALKDMRPWGTVQGGRVFQA